MKFKGQAEQFCIINVDFDYPSSIIITVQNSGSATVNFRQAYINGVATNVDSASSLINAQSSATVILQTGSPLVAGSAYTVKLISAAGTSVVYTAAYNA